MEDSAKQKLLESAVANAPRIPAGYLDPCLRLVRSTNSTSAKANYDFFIIGCTKDEINEREFLERIYGLIVRYALKTGEYTAKEPESFVHIVDTACSRFTSQEDSGELGELTLFALLECYRNAPQIINKMSLKTDPNMHFLGFDAIHLTVVGDEVRLYYGESKTWKDHKAAVKKAISSINDYDLHPELEEYELNLACSNIDSGKFGAHVDVVREYLNPYGAIDKSNIRKVYAVFIGTSWDSLTSLEVRGVTHDLATTLENEMVRSSIDFTSMCDGEIIQSGIRRPFEFFVIPFEDIAAAREAFRAMIGARREDIT